MRASHGRFVWSLLMILSLTASPVLAVQPEENANLVASPIVFYPKLDLDEDATAWNVFVEGSPTWALSNVLTPSQDGRSLRCAITGGEPYSNLHCYRNLPAELNSNMFVMSMAFYYRPQSSFNNVGTPSIVQGLEFTVNKWENGLRYEWALQWDNVDLGAPKWRYWDPAHSPKWVDVGISGEVSGMQWHTLVLEGGIFNGQVHYRRFIFDGQSFPLDVVVAPALSTGEPDRLAIAVQLDGNSIETPYEVFLDNVTLATAQTFVDVPFRHWAFDWIQRLYASNVTGGCSTSPLTYCPEGTVTRAQMAVFLMRGIHTSSYTPPAIGAGSGFGDVPVDYWSASWIKQLAAEGITGGCGSGNYCPEYPVTRDQMAVFLLRSKYGAGYSPPAVGTSTGFGDVPVDHWAAPWIKQLVTEGITSGCGNGNYCPDLPVTRAQMAVFLVRTFSLP